MCEGDIWRLVPVAVLFLFAALASALGRYWRKTVQKIQAMPEWERLKRINDLAEPFGFFYVPDWDIFSTRRDAWQREMGYEALFDAAAPSVHMVMDLWPVYFDYGGRTWLVEFWRGQYGINTGAEVGVYHADRLLAPGEYKYAHFDAAGDDELPWIRCRLTRGDEILFAYEARHWWLTGFAMGRFSSPGELVLTAAIAFESVAMAAAFCEGLTRCPGGVRFERRGSRVYIRPEESAPVSALTGLHRAWAQFWNRFWVRVFLAATRPFSNTAERLLFLCELVPGCVRLLLGFDRKHFQYLITSQFFQHR